MRKAKRWIRHHVWFYHDWTGKPVYFGNDEYLRRTLLLGTGFGWAVVFAFWQCRCVECDALLHEDPVYRRWTSYKEALRNGRR